MYTINRSMTWISLVGFGVLGRGIRVQGSGFSVCLGLEVQGFSRIAGEVRWTGSGRSFDIFKISADVPWDGFLLVYAYQVNFSKGWGNGLLGLP